MRLTKHIREQILNSVLADMKHTDYREQARQRAEALILDSAPTVVREAYRFDASIFSTGSCYIEHGYVGYPRLFDTAYDVIAKDVGIKKLMSRSKEQHDKRSKAESALRVQLNEHTTTEKFAKSFPELEKYIPSASSVKNLPNTTGTIVSLMDAGWPKEAA